MEMKAGYRRQESNLLKYRTAAMNRNLSVTMGIIPTRWQGCIVNIKEGYVKRWCLSPIVRHHYILLF